MIIWIPLIIHLVKNAQNPIWCPSLKAHYILSIKEFFYKIVTTFISILQFSDH